MKVCRNPDVLWREEDEQKTMAVEALSRGEDAADIGTSVLFADGTMLSLNILGTEIWKRCDGRSLDELIAGLLDEFDADPVELRADTMGFLSELQAKGFISYEE